MLTNVTPLSLLILGHQYRSFNNVTVAETPACVDAIPLCAARISSILRSSFGITLSPLLGFKQKERCSH